VTTYRFEVEETEHGNYTAKGYKNGEFVEVITCVGKHAHAVSAGQRWKKRMLSKVIKKKSDFLAFGKFNGKTVEYVLINEPSYIIWLHKDKVIEMPEEIVKEAMERELQMLDGQTRHQNWGTGYMRQDT
jgi:hypothetical protein